MNYTYPITALLLALTWLLWHRWGTLLPLLRNAKQGNARAQTILAFALNKRNLHKAAFRWFGHAAEQGDAEAQLETGLAHLEGSGTACDTGEALRWIERAAQQGHAPAQCCFAELIGWGGAVPIDTAKSLLYWRKAAEQGVAEAQFRTGLACQSRHRATEQDEQEALRWYRLAAEQGHARAQSLLGFAYWSGDHLPQDFAEAYAWFRLAVENDPVEADTLKSLEKGMDAEQIEAGRCRVQEYRTYGTGPDQAFERVLSQRRIQEYAWSRQGVSELIRQVRNQQQKLTPVQRRRGKRLVCQTQDSE